MLGSISYTKQKAFTKKTEEFLSKEYVPEKAVTTYTPSKGDWYMHKFANYFAVFRITRVSRSDFDVEYYMVFPDVTKQVDAIITEIKIEVWKPISKPKELSWELLSQLKTE